MKITKNAQGSKQLTLTKAEYAELSKRYKFIREAKVVEKSAQMAPDNQLPAFMEQVDQLYRKTFNMPGGMSDAMKEQLATGIRTGLKNTQTGSPMSDTAPPVSQDAQDPMPTNDGSTISNDYQVPNEKVPYAEEPDEFGQMTYKDEDPSGDPLDPHYKDSPSSEDALDQPNTQPLNEEPVSNEQGDINEYNPAHHGIEPEVDEFSNGGTRQHTKLRPTPNAFPTTTGPGVQASKKNLDNSNGVYRAGSKFANGVDFSMLKDALAKGNKK